MSIRFAIALHRIKDAERSLHPTEQLSWGANEMASILREGDPALIELHTAWAGLAMVLKAQHEIASTFEGEPKDLTDVEERALCTLKQVLYMFFCTYEYISSDVLPHRFAAYPNASGHGRHYDVYNSLQAAPMVRWSKPPISVPLPWMGDASKSSIPIG